MNRATGLHAEAAAQIVLMLGVGSVAACASWSHVVDLAARHGQAGWLAVADAAVLETLAVSMGLEVRRRRRVGEPSRFAVCVLVAAVALQLSAQVAQAPRTFWGWTMAALPAIGFLLLAKVAIARGPAAPQLSGSHTFPANAPTMQSVGGEPDPSYDAAPTYPVGHPAAEAFKGSRVRVASDLLAAGRMVAAELNRDQAALTRAALTRSLRQRGIAVGTAKAADLLAVLKSERAAADGPENPALRRGPTERWAADTADRLLVTVGEGDS